MADACGTTSVDGGPAICAVPVYPRAVTASLRQQVKDINLADTERRQQALERLQLPETMKVDSNGYKTMRDAAMIELQFASNNNNNNRRSSSWSTTSNNNTNPTQDAPFAPALVKEIDVLRGREMVKNQTKSVGSICMVVRRPG